MGATATEVRTFLIADVRGYTAFSVERGDAAAARLAERFAQLVRQAVEPAGGELLELRGDEALATFGSPRAAIAAAVAIQAAAAAHRAEVPDLPIEVGIGLDAGEALPVLGGFRGRALNLAARLCSLAGRGEVLISESVAHLGGPIPGIEYADRGSVQLKGFSDPVTVLAVDPTTPTRSSGGAENPALAAPPQQFPIGGFLGALPAAPLVARDAERTAVARAVDAAAAGASTAVLLAGEPGVGKTRLAQEATLMLRDGGFLIALGACLDTRRTVPYYGFLDALTLVAAQAGRHPGTGVERPHLQALLGGSPPPGSGLSDEARDERLRREIGDLFATAARERPLALLLDDLHWADDSTIQLLHHLIRALRGERFFLLATYRDIEVGHEQPLERLLRDARREDLAVILPLRRLDAAATRELVASEFGEESISAELGNLLHSQTDGNPFFLQQVLRMLVERGDIYREGGGWERRDITEIEVPESVRSTIGERLGRLDESSREFLAAASVLGQRFQFDHLLAMTGADEDLLETALEGALGLGLLRRDGPDGYAFIHALAQQTITAELPTRRRRRLHAAAAAALEGGRDRGRGRAAEIAHHYGEADQPGPASRWSRQAGEEALAVFAFPEAEAHFRRAIEMSAEAEEPDLELSRAARQGLGMVLHHQRRKEGLDVFRALAGELRAADEVDGEGAVLAHFSRATVTFGRPAEGLTALQEYLGRTGERSSPAVRAEVLVSLSRADFAAGRPYEEMLAHAQAAEAAAVAAGAKELQAAAIGRQAHAVMNLSGNRDADALYRRALKLVDDSFDPDNLNQLYNNVGFNGYCLGDFARNIEFRAMGLEMAERTGVTGWVAFSMAMAGQALESAGELARAEPYIERSLRVAEGETVWQTSYTRGEAGQLRLSQGRFEEAEHHLREARAAALANLDTQLEAWSSTKLAELLELTDRADQVPALLDEVRGRVSDEVERARVNIARARALLRAGDVQAAVQMALESARVCESRQWLPDAVDAHRTAGLALAGDGRVEESEAEFARALELGLPMPYAWGVTRAYLDRAQARLAHDDREGGEADLAQARAAIERWGQHGLDGELARLEQALAGA